MSLAELSINTIRTLAIDAVQKANSGHPGLPLGAAPMAYVLWRDFLNFDPDSPDWPDRDRFILSAGHGSMLLYSLLHLSGYDLSLEEIKRFRQLNSKTPGHPEYGLTPGVETTTGPLGQGFANGIGMAIAEAHMAARFNRPGFELIDHYTYGIVSDGDLMEGISAEAASLAGHLRLGKLIYLYDDNRISIDGSTDLTFTEDRAARFRAYGWHVLTVEDGNDLEAIATALKSAQKERMRPSLICIRTIIGYGSPNKAGTAGAHGEPLGIDEVQCTKAQLGWPYTEPFFVPEEVRNHFREISARGKQKRRQWLERFNAYRRAYPDLAREFIRRQQRELPPDWESKIPAFTAENKPLATRSASGTVLNALAPELPELIGGSADLTGSTKVEIKSSHALAAGMYDGRTIYFGVREHAMAGIANGLSLHGGLRPFVSTFLVFSDYMRPAIRLAALMRQPVIYIFTHDSIGLGEDGPTHQPIEHYAALRAIPNLLFIRPCDANETAEAWKVAIQHATGPVAIALTRQNIPIIDRTRYAAADGLERGAYVLFRSRPGTPELVLIASGSEVWPALQAGEKLAGEGLAVQVVSMPCWELFDAQPEAYRHEVLPPACDAKIAIEAGISLGWHKYIGPEGMTVTIDDRFGASAPCQELMRVYGFTIENIVRTAGKVLAGTKP